MAKVTITGMRAYKFKDEQSGREVEGMSVYYKQPLATKNGNIARGYTSEKLSVQTGTDLYDKMIAMSYDKPFEANAVFDILPNSKRPVLMDIQF